MTAPVKVSMTTDPAFLRADKSAKSEDAATFYSDRTASAGWAEIVADAGADRPLAPSAI